VVDVDRRGDAHALQVTVLIGIVTEQDNVLSFMDYSHDRDQGMSRISRCLSDSLEWRT
jgi:hypothetical protein